jgi:hypothetical protein
LPSVSFAPKIRIQKYGICGLQTWKYVDKEEREEEKVSS